VSVAGLTLSSPPKVGDQLAGSDQLKFWLGTPKLLFNWWLRGEANGCDTWLHKTLWNAGSVTFCI